MMYFVGVTTLRKEYPEKWNANFDGLLANTAARKLILENASASAIEAETKTDLTDSLSGVNVPYLY